jgi:hypothetical protein
LVRPARRRVKRAGHTEIVELLFLTHVVANRAGYYGNHDVSTSHFHGGYRLPM